VTTDSVIPHIAGITAGSPLAAILEDRQTVLDLTQQSHDALLSPADPGGLSPALRAALATRVATINADHALVTHYRALLETTEATPDVRAIADPAHSPTASPDADPTADPRIAAIVGHADLLTTAPQDSTKATIEALQHAGVHDSDIVRLTQLIGFVNYQVRFATGLRLIAE